ncbi:MAG: DEAD/DEAH box helicase [Lentisphaeria bacterium]|nr:DEAD/DEAH box helicase [Lentisphaeria bacterium]
MGFKVFNLLSVLVKTLAEEGIDQPTEIQEKVIPAFLKGQDLMACSITGSGKTLSFLLPLIDRLYRDRFRAKPKHIRSLILVPTLELAKQIEKNIKIYTKKTKLRSFLIAPGKDIGVQKHEVSRGLDIVVATPGRLLNLVRAKHLLLDELEFLIVDEADLMLDMGFIRDIEEVNFKTPDECQKLMCSATFNSKMAMLADEVLTDSVKFGVGSNKKLADGIEQVVLEVEAWFKPSLLLRLIKSQKIRRGLIFIETQQAVDRITQFLNEHGVVAEPIHGGLMRRDRQKSLENLESGKADILVATDVASRGLHIDYVSHIINYNLPRDPETYIHRLGRTARGKQKKGFAATLCTKDERHKLAAVEKLLGLKIRHIKVEREDAEFTVDDDKVGGIRRPRKGK